MPVRLLHSASFLELTPHARLVLLIARLTAGAAGIRALPGLTGVLAETSGLGPGEVDAALAELVAARLIERQQPVLWILDALADEPSITPANPRHRAFVAALAADLPALPIVDRFRLRYPEWFGPAGGPSEPPGMGPDSPSIPIPEAIGTHDEPVRVGFDAHREPSRITVLELQPSPVPEQQPLQREAPAAAAAAADSLSPVELLATRLAVCANLAIAARFGEQTRPIRSTTADARTVAEGLSERGVPIEFAEQTIREVVSRYPEHKEPPRSLRYFAAAILEAHDAARDPAASAPATAAPTDPTVWARATTLLQALKATGLHKAPFRSRDKLLTAFVGQRWIADEARFRHDFGMLHVSARAMLEGKTEPQAVLAIVERLRAGVQEELPRHLRDEGAEHPWLDWSGRAAAESASEVHA